MYDNMPQLFEAGMMICFGISWPLSIIKTIKTKNPKGKSFAFTALVITGYLSGVVYKLIGNVDWVIAFYLLNTVNATIDLTLCLYYQNKLKQKNIQEQIK